MVVARIRSLLCLKWLAAILLVMMLCGSAASARELIGVIDLKGHYVIPAKYQYIHYMRHDLFACRDFDGKFQVFDKDGHRERIKLPEGTNLADFSFSDKLPTRSNRMEPGQIAPNVHYRYKIVDALANGLYEARLDTTREEPPVVLDEKSEELVKLPIHAYVFSEPRSTIVATLGEESHGLVFYDKTGHFIRKIDDVETQGFFDGLALINTSAGPDTVIDEQGNVVYASRGGKVELAGADRLITSTHDKQFIRSLWFSRTDERRSQFENFLADNQLVGMDVATLVKVLGPADYKYLAGYTGPEAGSESFGYMLSGFGSRCGNAYTHVEFKPEGGRIQGWKVQAHGAVGNIWITSNEIRTLSEAEHFGYATISEQPKHR